MQLLNDLEDVDAYLNSAHRIVSSVKDPFELIQTISFFSKNLESVESGKFSNWERFYKLCVEKLEKHDTSGLAQELTDKWAKKLQPQGCWIERARAMQIYDKLHQLLPMQHREELAGDLEGEMTDQELTYLESQWLAFIQQLEAAKVPLLENADDN